jgi:hypothetical protein
MMGRLKWHRSGNRGAAMEVEYTIMPEDILAFYMYHMANLPKAWQPSRLLGCVYLVLLVAAVLGWIFLLQSLDLVPALYTGRG